MNDLNQNGFAFVPAREMRRMLEACGSLEDWHAFSSSWNDLATDAYMADKGRYRKRRYAVYHADASGTVTREAHQPHYQTLDYNPLHGGVERWFEPVTDAIGTSASMQTILKFCTQLFTQMKNASVAWHIEAHQFRIEAGKDMKGQPTPEGMHRDGRDYVLVLLIKRENIQSGVTSIHSLEKKPLGSFTLAQPFDAALVDDARVFHGVTAVEPVDAAKPAYRDVLVVTFKAV